MGRLRAGPWRAAASTLGRLLHRHEAEHEPRQGRFQHGPVQLAHRMGDGHVQVNNRLCLAQERTGWTDDIFGRGGGMNGTRVKQLLRSPWARWAEGAGIVLKLALLAVALFGMVAQP